MHTEVTLTFCDFADHIDLSFIDQSSILIELVEKGQLASNGKSILPYNVCHIHYKESIADSYDDRIKNFLNALGGDNIVEKMVSKYQARLNYIILGIPCKTSEWVEDGFISHETMRKLCDLRLDLHFNYT